MAPHYDDGEDNPIVVTELKTGATIFRADFEPTPVKALLALEKKRGRKNKPHAPVPEIPLVHRTKPITKTCAARAHLNGRRHSNPLQYLKEQIENKLIKAPMGAGQSWQFDIRDFPENRHKELRWSS